MVFTYLQTVISFYHNTVATGKYRLEVAVFEGAVGHFGTIFQVEGDVPHQPFVHEYIGQ